MDKIKTLIIRLKKIGIELELVSNYPWIYISTINGKYVTEKFQGNHGFTIAFSPIRKDQELHFTDIGEIFKLIRKYTKGKYNLFLDDVRNPEDCMNYCPNPLYIEAEWEIVRNYDEFVSIVEKLGVPEMASFDHDLADIHYKFIGVENIPYDDYIEKSGYHCAKWLIYYCIDNKKELPSTILIHTMNSTGGRNIMSLFITYKKVYGK